MNADTLSKKRKGTYNRKDGCGRCASRARKSRRDRCSRCASPNKLSPLRRDGSDRVIEAFTYGVPQADISVSFGFMHHVPLPEWRVQLLNSLIEATKPGGFVCVSFWEFLADEGLAAKLIKHTSVPWLSWDPFGDFLQPTSMTEIFF